MSQREKWIDETMNSLQGMQKAEANPFLQTRILAKLQDKLADKVPVRWALVSAMGFLLLLWINVSVFTAGNRDTQYKNENGFEQVLKEYGLGSSDIYSDNVLK